MKLLRQWAVIIAICFFGEIINRFFKIPIPGNVIGMVLLFALLSMKIIKLEFIEESSNFLLSHLAFFFVPPSVSLITNLELLKGSALKFAAVNVITTIVVMVVTGHVIQLVNRLAKKSEE